MTYVVDIDGTICSNTFGKYADAIPNIERINKINSLYDDGHTILYVTARGMGRSNNNIYDAYSELYLFTQNQLNNWGCKYHKIIFGKPSADVYIDDKGINDEDFFRE
jgi:hypothetical protein